MAACGTPQVISLKKLGVDDIVHFDFMEPLENSASDQSPSQQQSTVGGCEIYATSFEGILELGTAKYGVYQVQLGIEI